MKKRFIALIVLAIILVLVNIPAMAAENTFGNEWIFDEAQVISEETENYIKNLNENVFSGYKNKPQLGIIIINELPDGYTMDEYKLEQFNLYGVGTKEENCGMLFVFAINDRKYGLEIGDGFEKGSLLRKDLETDFISSDMKTLLQNEQYDTAVMQVVQHLEQIMADEESGVYAAREEEQRLMLEQASKTAKKVTLILCLVLLLILSSLVIAIIVCRCRDTTRIKRLMKEHRRHISWIKADEKELEQYFRGFDGKRLENDFLELLYEYFINKQERELHEKELKHHISEYKDYMKNVNNFDAFQTLRLTDTDTIIKEVDKENQRLEKLKKQNYAAIDDFVSRNAHRIENELVTPSMIANSMKQYVVRGEAMSEDDLERAFAVELKDLNFRTEYERFIEENKDTIDSQYFDSSSFYNSLKSTPEYQSYSYSPNYSCIWMQMLLLSHMKNRQREIQRRKEREAREAAQRRERARREQESRSSYSSFGGGFGGGRSSGGGFSGGW